MIVVITGPTAVGKTKLSVELAKKINGEIINADSMQIYKNLDIGTAKITEKEKEGINHYLFDIKEVTDDYTVFDYQKDCRMAIKTIEENGKIPIIVGGTGHYIKSALYDYKFIEEETNNQYNHLSNEEIYRILWEFDNNIKVDKNNRRRLVRALNYLENNNQSINSNNAGSNLIYDTIFIGLTTTRETLYQKINNRVDKMIENGLVEEVKYFYDKKIYSKPLISGIGYKELYSYFEGNLSLEEAISLIKRNSRRYAKRQYTFMNNKLNIHWIKTNFTNFDITIEEAYEYVKDKIKKV